MKLVNLYNQSDKSGANWYHEARQYCQGLADRYGFELETVVGVVSALSPGNNWERNKQEADWLLATNKGHKITPLFWP